MPFVGGGHWWLLLILLAIVLIIWGPGKLPDVGAGMGRAIREFRKATTELHETAPGANGAAAAPVQAAGPVAAAAQDEKR